MDKKKYGFLCEICFLPLSFVRALVAVLQLVLLATVVALILTPMVQKLYLLALLLHGLRRFHDHVRRTGVLER